MFQKERMNELKQKESWLLIQKC